MIKGGPATSTGRTGHWVVNFVEEKSGTESGGNPQEIPRAEASESLERHPEFFLDDTLVTIQIGKTLFKVHKYQLTKSEVFSDMFKIPSPKGGGPDEGSSPEHPIKLDGVAASDFAVLLRVLYASQFSSSQLVPEASLIIPAFRLANMFNFSDLRTHLLPLAEKSLDDVDKIVFAREFDIKEWVKNPTVSYLALASIVPLRDGRDKPDEVPSAETSEIFDRHPKFFFDNVLVSIRVENTLFNVHKYQLAKSEVFSDMFKVPKAKDGEPEEGSSPERPIVMKGVAASDFAALLTFLYANQFSSEQPTPEASCIIPAYRLAHMFNFSELCAYLLPFAEEHLDDVDKIVFAKEFDAREWLASAHVGLCQREEPLSHQEANKLGVDSVLIISHMREKHRNQNRTASLLPTRYYCYACSGMTYHNNGFTCYGCNSNHGLGYLRYNGPGRLAQNGGVMVDDMGIEEGVNQWVEDVFAAKCE
ncbi:unnamed protein product [Rhizoctonia solani]|uniref:BTB domain-containing protein n=1 Tax=Rhizoctonia solani TaxID=456999 RepID=A0A8H3H1S8_9AGAM|nr:unnamed protein product [Rhizoctonia solani]